MIGHNHAEYDKVLAFIERHNLITRSHAIEINKTKKGTIVSIPFVGTDNNGLFDKIYGPYLGGLMIGEINLNKL